VIDLVFVLALILFFVLCVGFVMVCERIIGPDPEGVALSSGPDPVVDDVEAIESEEVAA
jgi:hypothetical protein